MLKLKLKQKGPAIIVGIFVFSILVTGVIHFKRPVFADVMQDRLDEINNQIDEYEREVNKLKEEANTLSNQIAQYDAQISLTELKINKTQDKIDLLGGRIDLLETSLTELSNAFTKRAEQTYKLSRLNDPYSVLLSADSLSDAVSSYHYLKKIQEADRDLLVKLEKAQATYKVEKTDQEELNAELESQKKVLGAQKTAKANLLSVTKNDEKKYQDLLSSARAEFEAIQAVIAGKGGEAEVGHVAEGEKIATIIQGASCNSSGTHLHFTVASKGVTENPFNYLKPGIAYTNCSGSSCDSGDGDSFSPVGSWNWPIHPTVKFNQGYGSTWSVRNTWVGNIYNFHSGIDISSDSGSDVYAVQPGILYQGSYNGSNGCRLRYVRVDHDNSDLDTYYLHINY